MAEIVRVSWAGPVQSFALDVLSEHEHDVESLLPLCHYGPTFSRAVADDLGRYVAAMRKGEYDSACFWLSSALAVVGRGAA